MESIKSLFLFHHPHPFLTITQLKSWSIFFFYFLNFYFPYNYVVFRRNAPYPSVPWRGTNTENFVIGGSNHKGCKSSFLDQYQLQRHLQDLKKWGQAFLLCDYFQEKKNGGQSVNLCSVFNHGWHEFQLKYWYLCFVFCKIQVPDPARSSDFTDLVNIML